MFSRSTADPSGATTRCHQSVNGTASRSSSRKRQRREDDRLVEQSTRGRSGAGGGRLLRCRAASTATLPIGFKARAQRLAMFGASDS